MFESQKKEKLDEGKLEVSELGVIQLEEGEPITCYYIFNAAMQFRHDIS